MWNLWNTHRSPLTYTIQHRHNVNKLKRGVFSPSTRQLVNRCQGENTRLSSLYWVPQLHKDHIASYSWVPKVFYGVFVNKTD